MAQHEELAHLRRDIDMIDRDLVSLLRRRFDVVDKVISTKRKRNLPATIPARVEEVVGNARALAVHEGLPADGIERLWRALVDETIRYEHSRGVSGHRPKG